MERETYLSPPQATVFLSQRPSQMSPSTHHPLQYTDASSASHSLFLSSSSVRFRGWVVKRLTEGESRGQPVGSGGSSSKEIDWLAAWAHFNIWKWPEASAINQHSTLCHFSSSASFSYFPFLFTEDSFLAFYPAASFPISNPHPLQILPHPCQMPPLSVLWLPCNWKHPVEDSFLSLKKKFFFLKKIGQCLLSCLRFPSTRGARDALT